MVEFRHVYKVYNKKTRALKDVSFDLNPGELVFLSGPSGAGKTTVFNILAGFIKPTSGQINVFEKNIAELKRADVLKYRKKIGVIFQDYKLISHRTVYENIALPLILNDQSKATIDKEVRLLAEKLGIDTKLDSLSTELSGGQKQRVAIARALISKPELIIADEPTGNIDKKMSIQIMDAIASCREKGACVFVASHNDDLVKTYAQRVIQIDEGVVV